MRICSISQGHHRTAIAVISACAMLLAASIVSPALGGPSIGSVAKKALSNSKSAKRSAASAQRAANSANLAATAANSLAATANGKADQALARPSVNPGRITTISSVIPIGANDIAVIAAVCPAGQRVISGGVLTLTGGGGTWMDRASDDRTSWLGGGEDLAGGGGTVTTIAHCVPAGGATVASVNRAKIRRELAAARRAKAAIAARVAQGP